MRQKTDILSIMEGAARWHAGPVEACLCREPAADQGDADPGPIECEGGEAKSQ